MQRQVGYPVFAAKVTVGRSRGERIVKRAGREVLVQTRRVFSDRDPATVWEAELVAYSNSGQTFFETLTVVYSDDEYAVAGYSFLEIEEPPSYADMEYSPASPDSVMELMDSVRQSLNPTFSQADNFTAYKLAEPSRAKDLQLPARKWLEALNQQDLEYLESYMKSKIVRNLLTAKITKTEIFRVLREPPELNGHSLVYVLFTQEAGGKALDFTAIFLVRDQAIRRLDFFAVDLRGTNAYAFFALEKYILHVRVRRP